MIECHCGTYHKTRSALLVHQTTNCPDTKLTPEHRRKAQEAKKKAAREASRKKE